jgi:hypothetical protein
VARFEPVVQPSMLFEHADLDVKLAPNVGEALLSE